MFLQDILNRDTRSFFKKGCQLQSLISTVKKKQLYIDKLFKINYHVISL